MRSPLTWYGGKGYMARHIVPLLPTHTTYCEPFFGGGSVFFRKAPAAIEVINDIHSGVVTLYRVLRDPALFGDFRLRCDLTPYSREEWQACAAGWESESDPVVRAWQFFVTARQTFSGHVYGGAWKHSITDPDTRAVGGWLSAIEGLPAVHERLRETQIEHGDWLTVFDRYDRATTLFYLDPPYVLSTRGGRARYEHEMTEAQHRELIDRITASPAMVVLSGFVSELYEPLERAGWERHDFDVALSASKLRTGERRIESVWINPPAAAGRPRQLSLEHAA